MSKVVCAIVLGFLLVESAAASAVPERADIESQYTWDLERIFPSVEAWEESFTSLAPRIEALTKFQGKLDDPDGLLKFLSEEEDVSKELGRLYVYANMKKDEDLRITRHQELTDKVENLSMRHAAATSFFRPEILAVFSGPEVFETFAKQNGGLARYRFYFSELLREKVHVLSHSEEELLAQTHEIGGVAKGAFTMLTNADMKFPTVKDENGQDVELTEERYYKLSRSKDRSIRKAAFDGIHNTYGLYKNAIGTLYAGSVKRDIFYSRARKYKNSLESALFPDNVSEAVYKNVVRTANDSAPLLHDYMELRRRALKLEELRMYDLNVPLSVEPSSDIPYEKAIEMVAEALAPLGDDYVADLRRGFSERWIDVYENQGKRKGAYSWGSYGTQPYVLLNYNGTLRDVFTIAHEMGHAMHSFYSHKAQPQVYADYSILLAEVASTTNEALLLEYLLRKSEGKPEAERLAEKKWLLTYYFDMVRTTFFRQAMFAEFEQITHSRAEEGEALTPEWLCDVWGELCAKYHGPAMTLDEPIRMEWARIPHFYSAFYVYKYVTGFAAAGALSQAILTEGEPAKARYIDFLKSGSSDFSLDILAKAGVDLRSPAPFLRTMTTFEERLNQAKRM